MKREFADITDDADGAGGARCLSGLMEALERELEGESLCRLCVRFSDHPVAVRLETIQQQFISM